MTEDERRRRISMVYDLLLRLAEEKAGGQQVDSPTPPATGEPQGIEPQDDFILYDIIEKSNLRQAEDTPEFEAS